MKKLFLINMLLLFCASNSSAETSKDYNLYLHNPDYVNSYMSLSVLFDNDATAYVTCNDRKSDVVFFKAGVPQDITLEKLDKKGENKYQLYYSLDGVDILSSEEFKFIFPPKDADDFSFTISSASLKAISKACELNSLFHIGLIGSTDDKAARANFEPLGAKMQVFATKNKKNAMLYPLVYDENYYAFEQGEALVVVLDSKSFSAGGDDPWAKTLGKVQYSWLKKTLSKSNAKHKFVFVDDLFASGDAFKSYEWGGKSDYAKNRKGWKLTLHELMKENGVDSVFSLGTAPAVDFEGVNYVFLSENQVSSITINGDNMNKKIDNL